MPQININEIDESIFTRVVSDDYVRVVVPGIASFGPTISDTNTDFNSITFTDVNDWQKMFGYTEPEYSPFRNDVSRLYAKQLIQRGAAVTFLRVNTGNQSILYDKAAATTAGTPGVIPAALHSFNNFEEIDYKFQLANTQPDDWASMYMYYFQKVGPGNTNEDYVRNTDSTWATNKYYKRVAPTGWTPVGMYIKASQRDTTPTALDQYTLVTATDAPANWGSASTFYTKDSSGQYTVVTFTGSGTPESPYVPAYEPNKYYVVTAYDYTLDYYVFAESGKICRQIDQIVAKYTGSFGNRLLVSFTPVTSKNTNYAYQYSTITVYRADVTVETDKDSDGNITVTKRVTGIHKLESHLVTTNPDDVNFFGNDLFKYITIKGTDTAVDELSVIWSNMETNPVSGTTVYSGFPDVPVKYVLNGLSEYNTDALLTGGTDFVFDEGLGENNTLNDILGEGFGGYDVDGTAIKSKPGNVNRWIWASYRKNGVVDSVLTTIANCYENYSDPYIYDFDFITAGGFIDETYTIKTDEGVVIDTQSGVNSYLDAAATKVLHASSTRDTELIPTALLPIHTGMMNLVNTRQDCIALLDSGPYWEPNSIPDYITLVNSSYATMHNPWCYCNNPDALGTVLMPPSFVFLYTLLSNLINNTEAQKWFPPAGVTRATARIVKKPLYEIGSVILNNWQNDTLARVNPIMKLKNFGYVIYGQYTAYVAQDEFTHSALESLNVRLISNCVKKQIFNTCLKLAFEPNNSSLWMKFYDSMDKYLLFMKRNDGLYDYRIQMDEATVTTDDINELRCPGKVWINPTRTAEFFDIDFILTDAGVTFTDTTGEVE